MKNLEMCRIQNHKVAWVKTGRKSVDLLEAEGQQTHGGDRIPSREEKIILIALATYPYGNGMVAVAGKVGAFSVACGASLGRRVGFKGLCGDLPVRNRIWTKYFCDVATPLH